MFEEDIFKDAKYCVPCNKFYVTNLCPFCTPKKESRVESQESGIRNQESTPLLSPTSQGGDRGGVELRTQDSRLDSKVTELSLEIDRLRRENKEKKKQLDKEKELELKFNILADKFERLSQKEKEQRNNIINNPLAPTSQGGDRGGVNIRIKRLRGNNGHSSVVRNNENDAQTKLLKERINELNAELERLQQRNEGKDLQVLQSTAEASKLSGIVEQQKDELERLRFDIQERDRVIMQISLTLSSAISQALTQRGQEKLLGVGSHESGATPPFIPPLRKGGKRMDGTQNSELRTRTRKTFYVVLGCLNAAIIGYLGCTFLYKKGIINLILEFFTHLW